MDLGIAGKTALVCASTSGLGAATGEAEREAGNRQRDECEGLSHASLLPG